MLITNPDGEVVNTTRFEVVRIDKDHSLKMTGLSLGENQHNIAENATPKLRIQMYDPATGTTELLSTPALKPNTSGNYVFVNEATVPLSALHQYRFDVIVECKDKGQHKYWKPYNVPSGQRAQNWQVAPVSQIPGETEVDGVAQLGVVDEVARLGGSSIIAAIL